MDKDEKKITDILGVILPSVYLLKNILGKSLLLSILGSNGDSTRTNCKHIGDSQPRYLADVTIGCQLADISSGPDMGG